MLYEEFELWEEEGRWGVIYRPARRVIISIYYWLWKGLRGVKRGLYMVVSLKSQRTWTTSKRLIDAIVCVCGAIFIDDSYMHKSGICTIRLVRARLRVDSFSSLYTFACVPFGNWCWAICEGQRLMMIPTDIGHPILYFSTFFF